MTKIETSIWQDIPSKEDPFQTTQSFCHGYDLTADLLPHANWFEYIYLLFTGNRASTKQCAMLERLSVLLANPGVRDFSVRAAMNAGVAKAPAASVLISALAVGSGQFQGGREVFAAMHLWQRNLNQKAEDFNLLFDEKNAIWPASQHIAGFEAHSDIASQLVFDAMAFFHQEFHDEYVSWLAENRSQLEAKASSPVSLIGLVAAIFCDLQLSPQQAEFLFLFLRLPGAAAHAMEQEKSGWRKYPFFADTVKLESLHTIKQPPNIDALIEQYIAW